MTRPTTGVGGPVVPAPGAGDVPLIPDFDAVGGAEADIDYPGGGGSGGDEPGIRKTDEGEAGTDATDGDWDLPGDGRELVPDLRAAAPRGERRGHHLRIRRSSDDWARAYQTGAVVLDLLVALGSASLAVAVRFTDQAAVARLPYLILVGIYPLGWVLVQALSRSYERRYLGLGPDEFKRIVRGAVSVTAVVCFAAFTLKLPLSRGVVAITLPLTTVVCLAGRYALRKVLHRARRAGRAVHRVLVVGSLNDVVELVTAVRREPSSGFLPVGACLTRRSGKLDLSGPELPVVGGLADVLPAIEELEADMVAICGARGVSAEGLRRLSWELEGTGVGLVVAPALTNVAGPRIHVRPVAGLPLLHVEEPVFTGASRVIKTTLDTVLSALLLLLLSPFLLVLGALVGLTSPGGVFFRQERIGINEQPFRVWKFRSMYVDAEARRAALGEQNETDGLMFKMREDPRVTPIGRFLRRYSLDELPQLFNVAGGSMSLIGPRPPLPDEVEQYEDDVRRRLLVRPGMTGLWQVSGRADLPWEDAVRLDLYYVDNWSLMFDLEILWKTFFAVVKGSGAY